MLKQIICNKIKTHIHILTCISKVCVRENEKRWREREGAGERMSIRGNKADKNHIIILKFAIVL